MKSCAHCGRAEWRKTAAGRLHPSGDGQCLYVYKPPQLPASMYWFGRTAPKPNGGQINRHTLLPEHCQCWTQKEAA